MRPLLVLILLVALAPAAPVPKALKKPDDKSLLTGTWTVTGLTVNGQNATVTYDSFTFDDGRVTLRSGKGNNGVTWAVTLDPAASPRRMQWEMQKGQTDWDLVYEVSEDTLKVGFLSKGTDPPAAVEPGYGLTLYVLSRVTPAK